MHPENVWKWLDAVDQECLDPMDQWGVPPSRYPPQNTLPLSDVTPQSSDGETYKQYNRKRNSEAANLLKSIPPAGILLRNGSIRVTRQNPKFFAYDVKKENHPQSLLPGFAASSIATGERTDTSSNRQIQDSRREGNVISDSPKRLPSSAERGRDLGHSGTFHSTPTIHVEVKDPIAINCRGARVVGGHQQDSLQSLPSMGDKSRRISTAGGGPLQRSNAIRRPSNVGAEFKARPQR